jgi:hypothetical protein
MFPATLQSAGRQHSTDSTQIRIPVVCFSGAGSVHLLHASILVHDRRVPPEARPEQILIDAVSGIALYVACLLSGCIAHYCSAHPVCQQLAVGNPGITPQSWR